jgi:hypothetical protein
MWNRDLAEKHDETNSEGYDGKRGVWFEMIQVRLEWHVALMGIKDIIMSSG